MRERERERESRKKKSTKQNKEAPKGSQASTSLSA